MALGARAVFHTRGTPLRFRDKARGIRRWGLGFRVEAPTPSLVHTNPCFFRYFERVLSGFGCSGFGIKIESLGTRKSDRLLRDGAEVPL